MTSGSKSTSSNYGNYSARVWSGDDGKYYLSGGRKIPKWNKYSMTEYSCSSSKNDKGYTINCGCSSGAIDTDIPGFADVKLQAKLTSKVRGHDFNAGVAFAEADKTSRMVVDTVSTIGRALRDIKHGNIADAARQLGINNYRKVNLSKKITQNSTRTLSAKDISGRWLEMQYGWLPLVNDVHEAANMLNERTSGPRIDTVHTSVTVSRPYNGSCSPSNWSGSGTFTITKHLWYEMKEQLSNQRSVGLTHPLSIAWEVMPYSFVIDWFIPIGSYLDNLAVIPSLKGRKMTMIVRTWVASGSGTSKYYAGCTGSFSKADVKRTVSSELSLAIPSFKSFQQAASGSHIANAIALAHQRLK